MTGSVVTRTLKDGSKSYAAVYRAGGKQKWKWFRKKKAAERFLTEAVQTVNDGSYVEVKPVLFGEVIDRWLRLSVDVRVKEGSLKRSTARVYRVIVNTHLRPTFGAVRSDQLSPQRIAEWRAAQADLISTKQAVPKTFNLRLTLLRAVLEWAKHPAQKFLTHDPLVGQKRLKVPKVEREFLEPREIALLLQAAQPPDDTLLRLAVYSGLRRGELFGLQWGDVDWGTGQDGGRLYVRRNLVEGVLGTPKTPGSIRAVDIPQSVLDDLNIYRAMYPPVGDGFVFRAADGTPLGPKRWEHQGRLRKTLARAGLRAITLHTLRHTYASLLINAGESPKYVSKQMGHSSIAITMDLYGHVFPETSVAAMKRLEQIMSPTRANNALTGQALLPPTTG